MRCPQSQASRWGADPGAAVGLVEVVEFLRERMGWDRTEASAGAVGGWGPSMKQEVTRAGEALVEGRTAG